MKKHLSFLGAVLTAGVLAVPAYAADSSYYVSGDAGVSLFSNITPKDPTQIQQGTLTTSAGIDVLGAVGMKFDSWRVLRVNLVISGIMPSSSQIIRG